MIIERKEIKQDLKAPDGTIIQYGLGIISNEAVELEELKISINNKFQNCENIPTIIDAVSNIKEALNGVEESYLWVTIYKDEHYLERVNYYESILNSYTYYQKQPTPEVSELKIDYDYKNGFSFSSGSSQKNPNGIGIELSIIQQIFNQKMEEIQNLQNLKPKKTSANQLLKH